MSVNLVERIMPGILAAEQESIRTKDARVFGRAVRKGVEEGLDLQTIEKALRTAGRITYLIARNPRSDFHAQHIQPRLPGDAKNQKYWLYAASSLCVNPHLLQESESYEDNFAKLKETGFATRISDAAFQDQFKKPHEWVPIDPPKNF
ncbi:MAG TPA: hypothetical protein VFU89_03060 [Rhabdochlamydiaceae bacterium]|nr:hypothetical protein [Rhabdochlamydiaceae bacterium]